MKLIRVNSRRRTKNTCGVGYLDLLPQIQRGNLIIYTVCSIKIITMKIKE